VSQLAVLASDVFDSGDRGRGFLLAARGVGSGLGPLIAARWARGSLRRVLTLCGWASIGFAVMYTMAAWAPALIVALTLVCLAHLGGGAQWMLSTYGLQMRVDDKVLGRVMAGDFAIITLVLSLTSISAGLLSSAVGVQWAHRVRRARRAGRHRLRRHDARYPPGRVRPRRDIRAERSNPLRGFRGGGCAHDRGSHMVQLVSGSGARRHGRAVAVVASLTIAVGAVTFSTAPTAAVNGRPSSTTTATPGAVTTIPPTTAPPQTTVPRPTTTPPTTTEAPTTTAAPATTTATLPQPPESTVPPVAPPTNPQIPVTAVPDADAEPFELPCEPDAVDDYYTTTKDEVVFTIPSEAGLGVNDQICPASTWTIDSLSDPAHGSVVKTPDDYGAFEYTPDPGFTGSDSFTYALLADDAEVDIATAHITVTDD